MKIVQLTTDNREHYKDYSKKKPEFGAAPEALLEGFAALPDIDVHVVCCLRSPVESPSKLADNIHYRSLLVPKAGWMSTCYQGCVRAIRRCLHDIGPDLVHGQGTERDCAISAVLSGFPNVLTIHGNMAELQRLGMHGHRLFGRLAATLESFTLRQSSGVFCNSAYTESLVAPRARHTWRVPNPIRKAFFKPTQSTRQTDRPQLMNVGLISPRKRQLEILRMAGDLRQKGYDFHLIFAGQLSEASPYGAAFATELRKAEKLGYASFTGFLGIEELIDLMDQSHGFIHAPLEEAFGLVVAEALARNLRVFGSNLGGIRDISQGVPGISLHDDFADLAKSMAGWMDAGSPLTNESASVIAERYHPEVIARRHLEIYHEVLGQ